MKILMVEDDATIRAELKSLLERYGYQVAAPESFAGVPALAESFAPHLVLLDLGLPMYDGHHICRELRKTSEVPIIVVTSRGGTADELLSMRLGADDFITKPYDAQVLLARIESVLRRSYGSRQEAVLTAGQLALHLDRGSVSAGGQSMELTKNELGILRLLMRNQGKIVSREQIMMELWQSDEFVDDNTLTVNMTRLRRKLAELGADGAIKTRRGQGYMV